MDNDKPICGACEHFDFEKHKMVRLHGAAGEVYVATSFCKRFRPPLDRRHDEAPYIETYISETCFKLWEGK